MTVKNTILLDSAGNKKGSFDVDIYRDTLFEFFYPKTILELDKDDQIIIPLQNNEEVVFRVKSFEFIEQHFDIAEHYVVQTEVISFPQHLEKVCTDKNVNYNSCKVTNVVCTDSYEDPLKVI